MKMKLNFSVAAIGGFFAQNGEKMVLGVMIFVLLCFLYGAITARPLDDTRSADAILKQSKEATDRINEVSWDRAPPEEKEKANTVDFQKLIAEDRKEVSMSKLKQSNEWDPRLFPALTKRGDPEIYPVGELQIASGYALVPYAHADASGRAATTAAAGGGAGAKVPASAPLPGVRAAGADARAVTYTILTGVIPLEKEELEYRRRFEYAMRPAERTGSGAQAVSAERDTPRYVFFKVQRAEVSDAKDQNLNWTDLDWRTLLPDGGKDTNKWATAYPEIVQKEYVLPPQTRSSYTIYVTWPLPPVYLKYWGLEAAHPKIPLIKPEGGAVEQPSQPSEGETPASPFEMFGFGGGATSGGAGAHKAGPGPTGGAAKSGAASGRRAGGANATQTAPSTTGAPNRLFRFIDLSAEKGKTYRYRVQLALDNPNVGLKPEELERSESAKEALRFSAWSEASAPVTTPPDARILANSVTIARGTPEVQGKIYILTLLQDEKTGDWVEAAKDFEVPLGGYASFKDVKIENVTDMSAEEVRTVTAPSVNADQAILLDVRNDDDVMGSGKAKSPTEMLFIDSTGHVKTYNSAVDGLILKDYQQRTGVSPESAPAR